MTISVELICLATDAKVIGRWWILALDLLSGTIPQDHVGSSPSVSRARCSAILDVENRAFDTVKECGNRPTMMGAAVRVVIDGLTVQEYIGTTDLRSIDIVVTTVAGKTSLNQALLSTEIE